MKTPLNWISLYTQTDAILKKYTIKDLAHIYSTHTAEIDSITEHTIDKVVVGKVLSCEKHPESKKLSIVRVELGEYGEETILTGAPNISEALYVPVAVVGAVLPGDFVIGERMMAGMMSRGMICGADEIGMSTEESTGIMVLEEIWEKDMLENHIGKSFFDLSLSFPGRDGKIYNYRIRDTTFEIDNKFITNRPDLFSVLGNAREWGAVFGGKFEEYIPLFDGKNQEKLPLSIETEKCLAYHAVKMENITPKKSPLGITLMMERAELSPKMDLVDITNCISVDFGQPMHVFDADKIVGGITVRMARPGEKLLALNDGEYTLTPSDMIIADDVGPIALAGVIGGKESAVSENTKNIIWESATFDATSVRLSAQRHGIRTDASTRYEKSLDPLLAGKSLGRILDYLKFLGKNIEITAYAEWIDEKQIKTPIIDISYDFINMKAGIEIPKEDVQSILVQLGFEFTFSDDILTVTVPSWRATKDISIKEDIAEEISRIYGYDKTPLTPLNANFRISKKNKEKNLRNILLSFFEERGWNECYNYSFTNSETEKNIGMEDMNDAIKIQNAFNESYTHMRRSLAPRLLENIRENIKHTSRLKFFEIGKCYSKDAEPSTKQKELLKDIPNKPFTEKRFIAGVMTGYELETLRQDIENLLIKICGFVPPLASHMGSSRPFLHPGISGVYHEDEVTFVRFGKIHPEVAQKYDIPEDTLYFEASFDILQSAFLENEKIFSPISKFQKIPRELNFVMNESDSTGAVAKAIDAHHPWIHGVIVDSIYRDEAKIGAGKKSVNFSFTLQSDEKTISDEEALSVQNSVIEHLQSMNYTLRQ